MEFDSLGALKSRVREWVDETPFELAGWSLLETSTGELLMGGNKAVAYMKSNGDENNKTRYSFSLKGVGTETNQVSRVRKLRNGKLIVVGKAYEEDCWTKYQRLSYDAWWSFISETGSNDSWNVAGLSGSDDALYDVTQLTDNRLAFLGLKGTVPDSGLWVFVTDSTAKTIQWEKQFNLPGTDGITTINNLDPYTIAATPDSGFIVVGKENTTKQGENAFAIKFVPKALPTELARQSWGSHRSGMEKPGTISFQASRAGEVELNLYDLRGKWIARYLQQMVSAGVGEFRLEKRNQIHGLAIWRLKLEGRTEQGVIPLMENENGR